MTMAQTTARFLGIPDRVMKRARYGQEEHRNAQAFFRWVKMSEATHPELRALFAIPNGGARNAITGARMKAEGVRKGVWDYLLAWPVVRDGKTVPGLWIELKAGKNGLTKEQREWGDLMREAGYACVTCWSWDEAKRAVEGYLGGGR